MKIESKQDYIQAVTECNAASTDYYAGRDTKFTDSEFDALVRSIEEYEKAHPDDVVADSPTQKVNEGSSEDKIVHKVPMLSLRDVFSKQEVSEWWGGISSFDFVVEPKLDGLSLETVYKGGKLVSASTRGDGLKGIDVTPNALAIKSIPNEITYTGELVVRSEVYMSKKSFERYVKNVGPAKNERNLAVGILKRINDTESAAKYLDALAFNLQYIDDESIWNITHMKHKSWLTQHGFQVVPGEHAQDLPQIYGAIDRISNDRDTLPYRIDGAVVKLNRIHDRDLMGDNGITPKWAIAYKYPATRGETTILDIDFSLGRTGRVTPVAVLEPIVLDGASISRVTLNNYDWMKERDICIGDKITIEKSGDIIPKLVSTKKTKDSRPFFFIKECPSCHVELTSDYCRNTFCPNFTTSRVHAWASKGGLDIRGVSSSVVNELLKLGLVKAPYDYYNLTPADLYKLPRMGTTKVNNILRAIAATKQATFERVISAMCIDQISSSKAKILAPYCKNWTKFASLTAPECRELCGKVAGNKLYNALQTPYYVDLIEHLKVVFSQYN